MFDLNRLLSLRSSRATADFNAMLNWKLLRGSHEFPGPDGGTCVNEAAIVAAGYPYTSVQSVDDCPSSFSRPMALFAMCLNDALDDELRAELLIPFVTRLAGSADLPPVERERAQFLMARIVTDILAPLLTRLGHDALAKRAAAIKTQADFDQFARLVRARSDNIDPRLAAACVHAADAADQWHASRATDVVLCASRVLAEISSVAEYLAPGARRQRAAEDVYRQAAAIFGAALKIGRQADSVPNWRPGGSPAPRRKRGCATRACCPPPSSCDGVAGAAR
jgi:hypothetical protein